MTTPLVRGKCTLRSSTRRISSRPAAAIVRIFAAAPLSSDVIEAGLEMLGTDLDQRRAADAAGVGGGATPRGEGAARRQLGKIGWLALDRHQRAASLAVEARDGGHQAQRVGMAWVLVELARRRRLD